MPSALESVSVELHAVTAHEGELAEEGCVAGGVVSRVELKLTRARAPPRLSLLPQLRRVCSDDIISAATDAEYPATFASVGCLASEVAELAPEFDQVHIIYNHFVSAVSYETSMQSLISLNGEGDAEPMMTYEFEPDTKSEILTVSWRDGRGARVEGGGSVCCCAVAPS